MCAQGFGFVSLLDSLAGGFKISVFFLILVRRRSRF